MGYQIPLDQKLLSGNVIWDVPEEDMRIVEINHQGKVIWVAANLRVKAVVFLTDLEVVEAKKAVKEGNVAVFRFIKKATRLN